MRAFATAVFLAASGASTLAHAGGWARPLGSLYAQAGAGLFVGENALLVSPLAPPGRLLGTAAELYTELGLGRGFELDATARWVDNRMLLDDGSTRDNHGPEDIELVGKYAPVNGVYAFSLVAGTRLSLYDRLPDASLADGKPQRGAGGTDILVGAAFGRSFWPRRIWLGVEALARIRVSGASAGVRLHTQLGGAIGRWVRLAGDLEAQPAFGREIDRPPGAPSPVPKTLGLGAQALIGSWYGLGLHADAMYFPDGVNDGPGVRVGLAAVYER